MGRRRTQEKKRKLDECSICCKEQMNDSVCSGDQKWNATA
jgi:hypothetical protein